MAWTGTSTADDRFVTTKDAAFFQELKRRIHRKLIENIDIGKLDMLRGGELAQEIGAIIESLIAEEGVPVNQQEKERLIIEVQHETFGLGPIEPLLADPDISDILVNNYANV